ncbi:unnamed protein product, partial [Iphiclides podalirius]
MSRESINYSPRDGNATGARRARDPWRCRFATAAGAGRCARIVRVVQRRWRGQGRRAAPGCKRPRNVDVHLMHYTDWLDPIPKFFLLSEGGKRAGSPDFGLSGDLP